MSLTLGVKVQSIFQSTPITKEADGDFEGQNFILIWPPRPGLRGNVETSELRDTLPIKTECNSRSTIASAGLKLKEMFIN